MQEKITGLQLRAGTAWGAEPKMQTIDKAGARTVSLWEPAGALLFYLAAVGSILSLLQLPLRQILLFALAGAPAVVLFTALRARKRIFVILWFLFPVGIGIFLIRSGSEIWDGLRILMNRLYDAGELFQAYRYTRFSVAGAVSNADFYGAALLSLVLAGGISLLPGKKSRLAAAVLLFLAMIFGFAYYGLIPEPLWLFLFLAAVALLAADASEPESRAAIQGRLLLLILAAVTAGLICFFAPAENMRVSELDEWMRDSLAGQTVHITGSKSRTEKTEQEEIEEQVSAAEEQTEESGSEGSSSMDLSRLFYILFLIVITLLLLLVPAFFRDRIQKKREKNRAGLDSEENRTALCAMFLYSMRWLKVSGIWKENTSYESIRLTPLLQQTEGWDGEYEKILLLWREAAFSDHPIEKAQRDAMQTFMKAVTGVLWEQADWKARLRIRYLEAL